MTLAEKVPRASESPEFWARYFDEVGSGTAASIIAASFGDWFEGWVASGFETFWFERT